MLNFQLTKQAPSLPNTSPVSVFLIFLLILLLCSTAAATDKIYVNEDLFIHIGDGSVNLPDAQGNPVNWTLDANYILAEDVDMVTVAGFIPIGNYGTPFTGSFDGQNFTISNFNFIGSANYASLFG